MSINDFRFLWCCATSSHWSACFFNKARFAVIRISHLPPLHRSISTFHRTSGREIIAITLHSSNPFNVAFECGPCSTCYMLVSSSSWSPLVSILHTPECHEFKLLCPRLKMLQLSAFLTLTRYRKVQYVVRMIPLYLYLTATMKISARWQATFTWTRWKFADSIRTNKLSSVVACSIRDDSVQTQPFTAPTTTHNWSRSNTS